MVFQLADVVVPVKITRTYYFDNQQVTEIKLQYG